VGALGLGLRWTPCLNLVVGLGLWAGVRVAVDSFRKDLMCLNLSLGNGDVVVITRFVGAGRMRYSSRNSQLAASWRSRRMPQELQLIPAIEILRLSIDCLLLRYFYWLALSNDLTRTEGLSFASRAK
jgi:hypothetical protein